jgi:hypothetical protein
MEVLLGSSIIRQIVPLLVTSIARTNLISWFSKTSQKSSWSLIPCNSMAKRATTLKIVSYCTRCLDSTTSSSVQFWKLEGLLPQNPMNGTSCGALQVARATFMRVSTSTKRSTISLKVMKLQGKIDFALMSLGCKKDLANNILTSFPTLISSLMSLGSSMNITKSLSNMIARRTFGLSSQQMQHKVGVSS